MINKFRFQIPLINVKVGINYDIPGYYNTTLKHDLSDLDEVAESLAYLINQKEKLGDHRMTRYIKKYIIEYVNKCQYDCDK